MMKEVIKRDGRIVSFDSTKILSAVEKAMKAAGCATLQGAAAGFGIFILSGKAEDSARKKIKIC